MTCGRQTADAAWLLTLQDEGEPMFCDAREDVGFELSESGCFDSRNYFPRLEDREVRIPIRDCFDSRSYLNTPILL